MNGQPWMKWIAGATLALSACGAPVMSATEPTVAPAPAYVERLADVGGRSIRIQCYGRGHPTVVYDAPLGAPGEVALPLIVRLAGRARVCAYDRANVPGGRSDPAPAPRTASELARDLRDALRAAGIDPPYVLVGDSFGAMVSTLFAAAQPDAVRALVLIEPIGPGALGAMLDALPAHTPAESRPTAEARRRLTGLLRDNTEGVAVERSDAELRSVAIARGLPVRVVRASAPLADWLTCDAADAAALETAWRARQAWYLTQGAPGVVDAQGGHDVLGDAADAVAEAVAGVLGGPGVR